MALAPRFGGHLLSAMNANTKHTIELYLDYTCPFSAKMFNTIYTNVKPLIDQEYSGKVQVIFRHQVQPWHPSSTLTHEAAIAVLQLSPQHFWQFSAALFKVQGDFMDVNVVNETRNATYSRLSRVASEVGIDEDEVLGLLRIPNEPGPNGWLNVGNSVTTDLKLLIKAARTMGVHVSPTVLFNGVEERSVSSGWTVDEWRYWLQKNVGKIYET